VRFDVLSFPEAPMVSSLRPLGRHGGVWVTERSNETHLHADFVSGYRELAVRGGLLSILALADRPYVTLCLLA
jgi:hypothetical protein